MPVRSAPSVGDHGEAFERFEELYRAYYSKIVAYARRRTFSVEDAEDVVATTFTVAWQRLDEFLGADLPLAWLYGVAYRTVLSSRRQVTRSARLVEKAAGQQAISVDPVERTTEARDDIRRAREAAATLSATDQEILRLAGWEECSHAELAQILDISRALVRTRLLRARRRLDRAYDRQAGEGSSDD